MDERGLRVWLEPSFDHGRTGAWLLDWPGAFCWGSSRAAALDRVPSAAHRFVGWLEGHGDRVERPALDARPHTVEEVPAYRLDDGYEVNASFAADDRPVGRPELERIFNRLGYARDDLLSLLDRLAEFQAGGGRLRVEQRSAEALASGASPGRQGDEVVRHLAGAEAWFASRLEPAARYEGPPRDGDPATYLHATRTFLIDALRGQWARDPALARVDGRGEHWTLAKVLRRAVYHSLDHLQELDRRLALAERRVDRLEVRRQAGRDAAASLPPAELRRLFGMTGMTRRVHDSDELTRRMLTGSTEVVSAWDGERLVGVGRVISDEATNAYVSTVAVAPEWQDRGLGRRLMDALLDGRSSLKITLDARDGAVPFYERLGFVRSGSVLVRQRLSGGT